MRYIKNGVWIMDTEAKSGSLDYTLATYVYFLHEIGSAASVASITTACSNIRAAANKAFAERVAQDVEQVLQSAMGTSPDVEKIQAFIESNYSDSPYNDTSPQELGRLLVEAVLGSLPSKDVNNAV